jgi:hypothetical protein
VVFACIPLIGFIAPIPWSLNVPQVYEAAIGAGQFFLIGGAYFALLAFDENSPGAERPDGSLTQAVFWGKPSERRMLNPKYLFLSGFFWACSVGSRAINVFSVIFFTVLIFFWIAKDSPKPFDWAKYIQNTAALLIPLGIGALGIGWYNWARFDSPFEFGLRYQITLFNLNRHTDWVFRSDYVSLNLHNYLLQPFEMISRFPFLKPIINTNFPATYFYAAGPVTGLLFSAPFLILVLGLFLPKHTGHSQSYYFFICILAGSFAINLLTLLYYFFSQTRFLVDLISQIALLAILGYWQGVDTISKKNAVFSKVFMAAGSLLMIATICIGLLLSFSSETNRMETLNPQLMETINRFFQ